MNNASNRDPLHLDGKAQGQIQLNFFQSMAYEALVRTKPGYKQSSTWSEVEPQLAESWEVSGDKLQITFKLRKGVKFHDKPPVNGREFDSEDVLKSWDNFIGSESPNNKAASANSLNPSAPIISWEAPDANTVVLKLAEPTSMIFQRLRSMITGEVGSIYPKEYGNGFDAQKDQIGTGGWYLDKFEPSVTLNYKRPPRLLGQDNSAWYRRSPCPADPGIRAAAGPVQDRRAVPGSNPHPGRGCAADQEGSPQLADGHRRARRATAPAPRCASAGTPSVASLLPSWMSRTRQAISMAFDRDSYIDAFFNVSKFQGEGLPVDTYYYTQMGHVPDWTLDPRDDAKFGENAKYYDFNMEEAKKLFDAAQSDYEGGKFPKFVSGRVNAVFGPIYAQQVEVMDQFARDLGFEIDAFPLDYNTDYLPKVVTQQGHFKVPDMGWAYAIGAVTSPDPTDLFVWRYYSKAGVTSGQLGLGTPGGPAGGSGDADVDGLIEKAKGEFDADKRKEIIWDLQRMLSAQCYNVPQPGERCRVLAGAADGA